MKKTAFILIFSAISLIVLAAPQRMASSKAPAATTANVSAATVQISNFQFAPKILSVKAGTTVTWVNNAGTHTVTADNGAFASDNLSAGQSFSFKFTKPGAYRYYCSFHGSKGGGDMSGMIKVTR
jgi:plastocyanin